MWWSGKNLIVLQYTFKMFLIYFLSLLKVSSCNLSEGEQRYLHQYVESTPLQCKFMSVHLDLLWFGEWRLLHWRRSSSLNQRQLMAPSRCWTHQVWLWSTGNGVLWCVCRTHHTSSSCPSPWRDSPWRLGCLQLSELRTWTGGICSTSHQQTQRHSTNSFTLSSDTLLDF